MSQHYSDPKRASEPHALPDVETFYTEYEYCPECQSLIMRDGNQANCADCGRSTKDDWTWLAGWFYWFCFPGCLPDGEPMGPFASEAEAIADAQEGNDDANL